MQNENMRASITLVISGDLLNPDEITRLLGVVPHISKRKGDVQTFASGKTVTAKFGLWEWRSKDRSASRTVGQHIETISTMFSTASGLLLNLPNAENVWLDVHLVAKVVPDQQSNICFLLDTAAISAIHNLGLRVEFTVDAVSPD